MKKILRKLLVVTVVLAAWVNVMGQEEEPKVEKPKKVKKEMPAPEKVEATGVVSKKEVKGAAKYFVTTSDGVTVGLPAKKGNEAVDYTAYEGKTVSIKGMGYMKNKTDKDGKEHKSIMVKSLESIEVAEAAGEEKPEE